MSKSKLMLLSIVSALWVYSLPAAEAKIVARDIAIVIDQVSPEHKSDLGTIHEARIFYDDSKIDPVTHRVKILHQQHTPMYIPKHPDPAVMPVTNAWLDLSAEPYRYHYAASPALPEMPPGMKLWDPYAVVFDENSRRMTIRKQSDGSLELSGIYTVSTKVLSGPAIEAVILDVPPSDQCAATKK